jgi:hypothetical protein
VKAAPSKKKDSSSESDSSEDEFPVSKKRKVSVNTDESCELDNSIPQDTTMTFNSSLKRKSNFNEEDVQNSNEKNKKFKVNDFRLSLIIVN